MARARNIKPGFFKNEELAELPFEDRLLFIGLWTLADREGKLEDRPRRIKMEIFPADYVDVDASLDRLANAGLIVRYKVDSTSAIKIPKFGLHQRPHRNETKSVLPDPEGSGALGEQASDQGEKGGQPLDDHGAKGGEPRTQALRSESLFSESPFSDSLNPDCLIDAPEAPSKRTSRPGSEGKDRKPKRGTQVDPDFRPDDGLLAWAREKAPGVDPEFETEKFIDHHRAKGTVARDWRASWRTWMRNAVQFQAERGRYSRTPAQPTRRRQVLA